MKQTLVISGLLFLFSGGWAACHKASNNGITEQWQTDTTQRNPIDSVKKDSSVPNGSRLRKYLALGDSYTIGEAIPEIDRYPRQLQDSLYKYGITIGDVKIVAQTGWTTANLLQALAANPPAGTYDLVTLLIGVNNQYQQQSLSQYSVEFNNLIEKCRQYAGNDVKKIVILSIPDYSVVPFSQYSDTAKIRTQLEQFNTINRDAAWRNGIQYIDVFGLSQEARFNKSMVAKDSLHFSGLEYAKWTRLLLPIAKDLLK